MGATEAGGGHVCFSEREIGEGDHGAKRTWFDRAISPGSDGETDIQIDDSKVLDSVNRGMKSASLRDMRKDNSLLGRDLKNKLSHAVDAVRVKKPHNVKDQKEDVKKVPADKQTSKDTKRNKEDKVKNPTPKKGKQKERPKGKGEDKEENTETHRDQIKETQSEKEKGKKGGKDKKKEKGKKHKKKDDGVEGGKSMPIKKVANPQKDDVAEGGKSMPVGKLAKSPTPKEDAKNPRAARGCDDAAKLIQKEWGDKKE